MKRFFRTNIGTISRSLGILVVVATGLAAISCDKNGTEPVNAYSYYPLEIGRYQIYDVKEEIYSSGQKDPAVQNYQEKDQIERVSTDDQGINIYTISRSKRSSASDYWQKMKEFSVTSYPDKVLTNIDNQTFFSLVLPVDNVITWDGNTFNSLDREDYRYEQINEPLDQNNLSFDKTLTVVERRDSSIIDFHIGIKKYALGVGLILDEQTAYEYCQRDDCIGSKTIESGTNKIRILLESGKR